MKDKSSETESKNMKIVVIGGTGPNRIKGGKPPSPSGHEVVAASPSNGVNSLTGEGLAEALTGAQVVIDVTNSPSFEDKPIWNSSKRPGATFLRRKRRRRESSRCAVGRRHRSPAGSGPGSLSGYFRAKMAQENLIKASADSVYNRARNAVLRVREEHRSDRLPAVQTIRLSSVLMQPIVSDDVAAAVADVALGKPLNGIIEIAGPDHIR